MKILPVLAAIALILCITSVLPTDTAEGDVLRIHVRANSNSTEDQQIKMQVKDAIVGYLTPLLADCDTKQKAKETVKENIKGIL
ncbi:MAG: stage II sporulation protein R, partial [Clostridia bacterium]|nr:stage II sporulation protein R [Clostridia bacterium]